MYSNKSSSFAARPAVVKKPKAGEKEMVGQQETNNISVGGKAPFLSRVVGKQS
jgi:hypothetical protein